MYSTYDSDLNESDSDDDTLNPQIELSGDDDDVLADEWSSDDNVLQVQLIKSKRNKKASDCEIKGETNLCEILNSFERENVKPSDPHGIAHSPLMYFR